MKRIKHYLPKAYLEINQQSFRLVIATTAKDKPCIIAEYTAPNQHLLTSNKQHLKNVVKQIRAWLNDFNIKHKVLPQFITIILSHDLYQNIDVEQDLILNAREIMLAKSLDIPEAILLKSDPLVADQNQYFFRKIIGYQINDKFTQKLTAVKPQQKIMMIVRHYSLTTAVSSKLNFLIKKIKFQLDEILPITECLAIYYGDRVARDQTAGFVVWNFQNIKFGLLHGEALLKYNFNPTGFTEIFQKLAHIMGCEEDQLKNLFNHCLPDNAYLPISLSTIPTNHNSLLNNWKKNFPMMISKFQKAWLEIATYIHQQLENWNQHAIFPIFYSGSALNWNHHPNFVAAGPQTVILDKPEQSLFKKNSNVVSILGAIRYEQRRQTQQLHLIQTSPQAMLSHQQKKWTWFQFHQAQPQFDYHE